MAEAHTRFHFLRRPVWWGIVLALTVGGVRASGGDLAGRVLDPSGQGVSGVRVVAFVARVVPQPVATARTDEAGRFGFPDLRTGIYEVAASKDGYAAAFGSIDTALRQSLDLVLRPAAARPHPRDSSWALRLPRRSILREVERPEIPGAEGADPEATESPTLQIEQLLSADAGPAEPQGGADLDTGETRVELASGLGDRVGLRVRGRREALDANTADRTATARRGATAMRVGMSYDTRPGSHLDVEAFFGERDYGFSGGLPSTTAAFGGEQRTWGYGAGWSMDLDEQSRVGVTMGYRNLTLHTPGGLWDRMASASGTYSRRQAGSHDLEVEFLAWVREGPVVADGVNETVSDQSSWSVRLDAGDTWWLGPSVGLSYGIAHQEAELSRQATVTKPRAGAVWTGAPGFRVRGEVTFDAVAEGPPEGPFVAPALERWGYDAEVEVPVAEGVRLRGQTIYEPIRLGDDDAMSMSGIHPLYLVGDGVSVRENRLAIVESRGGTRTHFELAQGRAEGGLTPLLPWSTSSVAAGEGAEMRYHNAAVGVSLPARSTDLRLEYVHLRGRGADAWADRDAVEESVEMRVRTALGAFGAPGDWSLLMAVYLADFENGDLAAWKQSGGDDTALDGLNRRVSAGVAVSF